MKSLLVILFTLIALSSAVFAIPAPGLIHRDEQKIHVTAPGPGPWKVASLQSVSWWTSDIVTGANLVIEIYGKKSGTKVFSGTKSAGTGTIGFTVGSDWDTSDTYYALVYLEGNKDVKDQSGDFTITN